MGASLYYAKISSVNKSGGTASVCLPDRENQVVSAVPFLDALAAVPNGGGIPKPGDTVAAIFEELNGQIVKGVILGKI